MTELTILIDIGNTQTKFILCDQINNLLKKLVIDNEDVIKENKVTTRLKKHWAKETKDIKRGLLISVTPKMTPLVKVLIKKIFNLDLVIFKPIMIGKIFLTKNQTPGDDIIAMKVATDALFPNGVIVFSLGTASVGLVFVNQWMRGIFIGPGYKISKLALVEKAELIQSNHIKDVDFSLLPLSTTKAINSGVIYQQIGFMEKIVVDMNQRFTREFPVILTGGFAPQTDRLTNHQYQLDTQLAWKGMVIMKNKIFRLK